MLDIHNTIPLALNLHYRLLVGFMTTRGREGGKDRGKEIEKEKKKKNGER